MPVKRAIAGLPPGHGQMGSRPMYRPAGHGAKVMPIGMTRRTSPTSGNGRGAPIIGSGPGKTDAMPNVGTARKPVGRV